MTELGIVSPTGLSFDSVDAVEIIAPDGHSAALLQDFAAPTFPAEIVGGPTWIVRFHPPAVRGDWVVDLLALVERWLKSFPVLASRPTPYPNHHKQ